MICPRCERDGLTGYQLPGSRVRVDLCPHCKGIWLQRRELERAAPEAVKDLRPPPDAAPARSRCPACGNELVSFQYPQTYVNVDICPKCRGVWLDHNELKEIRLVRGHLERAGTLEQDPIYGVKGTLIAFIDKAIGELTRLDQW
jgi:Zn-finger nucleic acid-binding protein